MKEKKEKKLIFVVFLGLKLGKFMDLGWFR